MLDQQALDRFASQSCQHTDHHPKDCTNNGTIWLHCRHHIDSPLESWEILGEHLGCSYPGCQTLFSLKGVFQPEAGWSSALDSGNQFGFRYITPCHDHRIWASYKRGSGKVVVYCYTCNNIVGEIDLNKEEKAETKDELWR